MKKILSFALAAALVLCVMTGCGKKTNPETTDPGQSTTKVETNVPAENNQGENTKDPSKPGEDKTVQTNPNLIMGDDLQWPDDKMGSLKPISGGKLFSINPDDESCTVGFKNVEAKDAEDYLAQLKSNYTNVVFESNEDGVILFMASYEEGTVSYTYDYKEKVAVVALSYAV